MSLCLKIMVKKMKMNKKDICNDDCNCSCNCDENDDYMLEKLYDMRNDIDFMIKVLQHRKEKSQVCQDILSYEDDIEDEEERQRREFQELLEKLNKMYYYGETYPSRDTRNRWITYF